AGFLAWAIARETDPDRWYSAFFAATGALTGTILLGSPSFSLIFWFLLGLRFVNRSTGRAPGILDLMLFYGLSLWLGFAIHWTIPLLATATVSFAWTDEFPRLIRVALAMPCGAIAFGIVRGWRFTPPVWDWVGGVGLVLVVLLLIPVALGYRSPRSVSDRTGVPLDGRRIRWALAWSAGSMVMLTAIGAADIQALAPTWAASAGTFVGWLAEALTTCHVLSK
ncbi:hypothetical protein KJ567_07050, partial [Candidatus Bipolaricaulota bacterium]|nr:hypothetical protein [Candidatus Bipolaricaulota bacterium]